MDGKGFQVWLSAARGLTRAQRREALGDGPERGRGIEGRDRAWCGRGPALSALLERGGFARPSKCGRTFNALSGTPLSGLALAVVRGVAGEGGDGEGLAARCDVAVSTAFRWRHRFLAAARSDSEVLKGIVEADETYVLESGRARAGWDAGTAAGRQGEEARPFARVGAGSHGGGPERDDGQHCAAQGRAAALTLPRPGGRAGLMARNLAPPRSG